MEMKAILVIDMPDDVSLDEWYAFMTVDRLKATEEELMQGIPFDESKTFKFVPLRPLPSFKSVDLNDRRDVVMFCHGRNTCLAEITGDADADS